MKKKDEINLWNSVKNKPKHKVIEWMPLGKKLGIPEKRLYYILEKWSSLGVINYGVSVRVAWIEKDLIIN